MYNKPSGNLPPSSRGGGEAGASGVAVQEAIDLLAARQLFGCAWLDSVLVARSRFGALAEFIELGGDVTATVAPLIGLSEALLALKSGADDTFQMPNIALVGREGSSPRMDLQVYWLPQRKQFLLVVSKVLSTGELEVGLAQQVRKRMIAEAELAQKSKALAAANEELTRANRDLAEFAYVISHDLKAPLRAMRYFADDIDRALAGDGQSDARVLAEQIRAQSRRMGQMLSDLLAYSKIGRQIEAFDMVDTGELVRAIVATIPRPPGIEVAISGQWPTFATYGAPLDLVLRNLVGNAISHHDRPQGHVRVACQSADGILTIEVSDDGRGIPPEWHEAIFLPFKTVGEASSGEHSGIGLALVRRIAESLGATVTLRSDPAVARGTTFTIGWPLVLNP